MNSSVAAMNAVPMRMAIPAGISILRFFFIIFIVIDNMVFLRIQDRLCSWPALATLLRRLRSLHEGSLCRLAADVRRIVPGLPRNGWILVCRHRLNCGAPGGLRGTFALLHEQITHLRRLRVGDVGDDVSVGEYDGTVCIGGGHRIMRDHDDRLPQFPYRGLEEAKHLGA